MAKIDALILAAGYSTRLYPLTLNTPKPLLNVGGVPMMERIIGKISEIPDLGRIFVVTNAKFEGHFNNWLEEFKKGKDLPYEIVVVNDGTTSNDNRLGPVGDVDFVLKSHKVEGDLLIVAGDNLFEVSLKEICDFKEEKQASILAVYDFKDVEKVRKKFGVVLCDPNGKVTGFEEKPENPKSALAATALYIIKHEHLKLVTDLYARPHEGELNAGEMIAELVRQKANVFTRPLDEWFDIGSKEDLAVANENYGSAAN